MVTIFADAGGRWTPIDHLSTLDKAIEHYARHYRPHGNVQRLEVRDVNGIVLRTLYDSTWSH